jgi:hypothetical protein
MFIMSLAAADITVGGIVMPISSVYAITGKKRTRWVFQDNFSQSGYAYLEKSRCRMCKLCTCVHTHNTHRNRIYSRTSNNGHFRGIQILSVIGGVR